MPNTKLNTSNELPPAGFSLALGIFLVVVGIVLVLVMVFAPDTQFRAPRWVVGVASIPFLLAGLNFLESAAIKRGWIAGSELRNKLLFSLIVTAFAIGAWWAALSPEKGQISIGRSSAYQHRSHATSHEPPGPMSVKNVFRNWPFFIGALITTSIAIGVWLDFIKQLMWREFTKRLRGNPDVSNKITSANGHPR